MSVPRAVKLGDIIRGATAPVIQVDSLTSDHHCAIKSVTLSSTTGGKSDRRMNKEGRCAERRRKYLRWEDLDRAARSGVLLPDRVVVTWMSWFVCIQGSTS
jgi:hypothetical protein